VCIQQERSLFSTSILGSVFSNCGLLQGYLLDSELDLKDSNHKHSDPDLDPNISDVVTEDSDWDMYTLAITNLHLLTDLPVCQCMLVSLIFVLCIHFRLKMALKYVVLDSELDWVDSTTSLQKYGTALFKPLLYETVKFTLVTVIVVLYVYTHYKIR